MKIFGYIKSMIFGVNPDPENTPPHFIQPLDITVFRIVC